MNVASPAAATISNALTAVVESSLLMLNHSNFLHFQELSFTVIVHISRSSWFDGNMLVVGVGEIEDSGIMLMLSSCFEGL